MSSLTNHKKRELAERLYIDDGYTAVAICKMVDVAPKTITAWKKGRKGTNERTWDERRSDIQLAPSFIKEQLLQKMKDESQKADPSADKLIKLGKAIESIDKGISIQLIIEVLKQFDHFMNEVDPVMGVKFLPFHKQFIQKKAAK